MRAFVIGFLVFAFLYGGPSFGRTLFVSQDGTSEYSVIYEAVYAAESGDTIRIAPGEYTEGVEVETPYWTELTWIHVLVADLTIIGAGGEASVVGPPEPWDLSHGRPRGVEMGAYWGCQQFSISGVGLRNMHMGIRDDGGMSRIDISECVFSGNRYSVAAEPETLFISNSDFEYVKRDGTHLVGWDVGSATISHCVFSHIPDGVWPQDSISFNGDWGAEVTDCQFEGGAVAVSGAGNMNVAMRNCVFNGQTMVGVASSEGCHYVLDDCHFSNHPEALWVLHPTSSWIVRNTVFSDVTNATIGFSEMCEGYFRNCALARGERYVVTNADGLTSRETYSFFDMKNNFWGTDNPDSIQAWIYDGNDDPEIMTIIEWEPYLCGPVGREKETLGGIKALFKGHDR